MGKIDYLASKLKASLKYRLFLLNGTYVLAKLGIFISPYYLNLESPVDGSKIDIDSSLKPVTFEYLTEDEIEGIYTHPESKGLATIKKLTRNDTILCGALKHNSEIMAFAFVNLKRIHTSMAGLSLKENEAYFFNQYTYNKFRGKNLAPYLRMQMYHYLREMGRDRLYSITEYFNISAMNFKNKLNIQPIKLGLFIKLFRRYEWNVTLKKYN